jgi:hypothetical protein
MRFTAVTNSWATQRYVRSYSYIKCFLYSVPRISDSGSVAGHITVRTLNHFEFQILIVLNDDGNSHDTKSILLFEWKSEVQYINPERSVNQDDRNVQSNGQFT